MVSYTIYRIIQNNDKIYFIAKSETDSDQYAKFENNSLGCLGFN